MTAAEILAELKIEARFTGYGRFYARCPQCSDHRRPENRKKRCLGVTIDGEGVKYGCNNSGCTFHGGRFYDDKRPAFEVVRKPGDRRGNGVSFRALYG